MPANPFAYEPKATRAQVVTHGKARFTVLTDRMIRCEYAADGVFEDRPTLTVANRKMPKVKFTTTETAKGLVIDTGALKLRYTGGLLTKASLGATFKSAGKAVQWAYGMKDRGNLGATLPTLDGIKGDMKKKWVPPEKIDKKKPILSQNPAKRGGWAWQGDWEKVDLGGGLLSRSGWAVVDDSGSVLLDPAAGDGKPWVVAREPGTRRDIYLLAYGLDYRACLHDAARVFGRPPLPPRYALGYWYSKYWAYTDKEIEELIGQFDRQEVPIDVMVIDMDWHKLGWTGYSFDPDYFPDHAELLGWLTDQDLKISLNLHPADGVCSYEDGYECMRKTMGLKPSDPEPLGPIYEPLYKFLKLDPKKGRRIPLDITDPNYMKAYFQCLHHPLEDKGVDFWWMDWQQGNTGCNIEGLQTLPWINHLHWADMEERDAKKRPLIFSRFGGIGAGRYPVGFSGDTIVVWESLGFQPYFTATAANVLYGYWSHDIGGHMGGHPTPELYTRWIQYGVFSPILRTHTSKAIEAERRVFEYGEPYKTIMMDALRQRYELVPYIYTENRRAMDTGVALCHPLYYDHPTEEAAYKAKDQYKFGEQMVVAPVIAPRDEKDEMAAVPVWLPKGRWWDVALGQWVKGGVTHKRRYMIDETPTFVKPGAVIPGQKPPTRLRPGSYNDLLITIYPGPEGAYDLYEDDGVSQDYLAGTSATIPIRHKATRGGRRITLGPAKGGFKGFLKRRTLELRLPGSTPPKGVKAGGKALRWQYRLGDTGWTYDGESATVIIRLRSMDVTKGVTIEVAEDEALSPKAVDGWKGLMTRLRRICQYNNLCSPTRPIHADERMAVHAAQAGNRVGRDPARFKAEAGDLKKTLKALPAALKAFQAGWAAKDLGPNNGTSDERVALLQRARDILATTKKQFGL